MWPLQGANTRQQPLAHNAKVFRAVCQACVGGLGQPNNFEDIELHLQAILRALEAAVLLFAQLQPAQPPEQPPHRPAAKTVTKGVYRLQRVRHVPLRA